MCLRNCYLKNVMLYRDITCDTTHLKSSYMRERTEENTDSASSDRTEVQNSSVYDIPIERTALRTVLKRIRKFKPQNIWSSSKDDRTNNSNQPEGVKKPSDKKFWSSEIDLVVNCIGFSVGLGNLWRFPYSAYKNGGGTFLIPYLILTFVISIPLYYMELVIGQYSRLDLVRVWSFCPFFKGLGITILLSTIVVQIYYNVVMAYAMFYAFQTFRDVLPWSGCFKWWGADDKCYEIKEGVVFCNAYSDSSKNNNCVNGTESSSDQFWKIYVLGLSSGLDDPGTIKWDLTLVLLGTWVIICILAISRHHIKFQYKFKAVYFTAFIPFLILGIYFCYTITLPGAVKGLNKLFIPKWSTLLDITVWSEAAQSSIYSVGLGMGGLITFGGKNDNYYNISRCAQISCMMDLFASVLAATVTFMVVGFLAEFSELEFSETTLSGQGLMFVTFPAAVLQMDISNFWSFVFFLMLFCIAVDSSIAMIDTISIGAEVLFCPLNNYSKLNVVLCSVLLFIAGLPCVTNGGAFVFNILDYYGGGHSVMTVVLFEAIAFGWGYGVRQASKDIAKMEGSKPSLYTKGCWAVLAPLILIGLCSYNISFSRLAQSYNIPYPSYAYILGWCIVAVVLLPIPVWMLIALVRHRKKISGAFKPGKVWIDAVQNQNYTV